MTHQTLFVMVIVFSRKPNASNLNVVSLFSIQFYSLVGLGRASVSGSSIERMSVDIRFCKVDQLIRSRNISTRIMISVE